MFSTWASSTTLLLVNLLCNIMLASSEFERDMIIQRTQDGKAIAKQNPNFRDGRPKKFSSTQINHALELLQTHSYKQVATMTAMSRATLGRAKKYNNLPDQNNKQRTTQ